MVDSMYVDVVLPLSEELPYGLVTSCCVKADIRVISNGRTIEEAKLYHGDQLIAKTICIDDGGIIKFFPQETPILLNKNSSYKVVLKVALNKQKSEPPIVIIQGNQVKTDSLESNIVRNTEGKINCFWAENDNCGVILG